MKKILTILLILFLSQVCFAGRLQEMQKVVIAAKNGATTGCSTCATGLVQAFVLDDGNADLDDWVGDNNLTLGADAADPAFAADNDGLEFDGDDYATFSPLLTDWGGGLTVAILFTIPNAATSYILDMGNSEVANQHISIHTPSSTAYNRIQFHCGNNSDANMINVYTSDGATGKYWIVGEYNGTDTAEIFRDLVSKGTDVSITESTVALDRARLGSTAAGACFYTGTVYRVMIWNRAITENERIAVVTDNWIPTKD